MKKIGELDLEDIRKTATSGMIRGARTNNLSMSQLYLEDGKLMFYNHITKESKEISFT